MDDISPDTAARIAALETQVAYLFQHLALAPAGAGRLAPMGVPQDILDLVRAGKKIDAIKRHRELYGSSLSDAKHAIDALG